MRHHIALLVFVCATLLSSPPALAQFSQQGPKLVGTGAVGNAGRGYSVSISADGNTAIVGGLEDNSQAGAAWVWTRSGGAWTQQGPKLVGSGAVGNAQQGRSVSLSADGNTAIVGGFADNSWAGAVWVWTRSGGVWTQQGTKLVGSGAATAFQGNSVSLSADGNTAIVGGLADNGGVGAVWVWMRSAGVWIQQGPKLVSSGAVGSALQGHSVFLSADGTTAIIGGPRDNDNNGGAGAAWVWTRSGGVWTQQGPKLVGSGAVGGHAQQGFSVSLSAGGNTAIVGGHLDNGDTGAAWVWTRSAGVWTQQGSKLVGAGAVGNASQGFSVSLSADGTTAIIGGPGDNNNNGGAGAAWVWTRSGGVWTQQGIKLVGSGAVGSAGQGASVSLSADGNTAIVGGLGDNSGAGAAWVFTASAPPVAPTIIAQPVSQTVNAGQNASFTAFAIGSPPLSYQWRKNGVNISGATSATLTLNSVGAGNPGGYSVIVSNPYGSVISANATLAVLANPTGGVPPTPPRYSSMPAKQSGKDSLILITHGWKGLEIDTRWVDNMADSISQNLANRGYNNWQVVPYKWLEGAKVGFWWLAPVNGYNEGGRVGQDIVNQGWTHVHLIGHSAGAALIQGALQTIKATLPGPVVHTTFLDPYVGPGNNWRNVYGVGADWSDSYFSIDLLTGSTTEGALGGAFNVDVTWLDDDKTVQPVYCPAPYSPLLPPTPCSYQAMSSHPWPHDFYTNTIPPNNLVGSAGLGFPLSKEGGGWDNRGAYPRGVAPRVLGNMPSLTQGLFPVRSDPSLTFNALLTANSGNGSVQLTDTSFSFLTLPESAPQLQLNSPRLAGIGTSAWLSIGVPVTNKVNFVSFDAQFTSAAGAAGLLTVYWNTNQIGAVDESVTLAGWHSYTFALPGVFEAGHYALGFSLDPFTNVVSSVTVTNVSTGYAGLTNPIALSATNSVSDATPVLTLTADAGFNYLVQASTNLIDWNPFAMLLNTNGTVQFVDPASTNLSHRFYRAVSP